MASTILVFVEQRGGEIKKAAFEALAAGAALAGGLGGATAAVIAGKDVSGLAATLGERGAAQVFTADADVLANYSSEGYTAAAAKAVAQSGAGMVVASATAMGKDLAPRLAARLGWAFLGDVTAASIEGGKLVVTRPLYAGKVLCRLAAPAEKVVVTVRPNVFAPAAGSGGTASVTPLDVSDVAPRGRVVEVSAKEAEVPDVAEAEIIVAGGRGFKGPENMPMLFDLAKALGAGVGASRAIVDAGWIDHDHQVGQTGKTVSPTLYIAAGVSGAIQHLAGMRTSKCIVAVNKDPEAPIFQVADYGIVGDLFEVLPKLTEAVRALKG